jgi:hypothetical protein
MIRSIRRRFRPSVEALDALILCDAGMPADAGAAECEEFCARVVEGKD